MSIIAGLDGCSAGWVCALEDLDTGQVEVHILPCIGSVTTLKPRPDVLAIDIPIGLTDSGPRTCDLEARRLLRKPRSNSVFPAPIRDMLSAGSYQRACDIGQSIQGKKLSQQTWYIIPKIKEVDRFLRSVSPRIWVREVHPEVSFFYWNREVAMRHPKKTPGGRAEREALVLPVYGSAYLKAQASLSRKDCKNDDLLDAFSALWSAERIHKGEAVVLPGSPPTDCFGLKMEIVA